MADIFRVVVPVDSIDITAWQLAAAYALKMATETSPRATEVVLLTHTKHQLDHTSLSAHLGPGASKAFPPRTISCLTSSRRMRASLRETSG